MRKYVARLFVLLTQLILVAALACLIASTVGTNWFENIDTISPSSKIHCGLISFCRVRCVDRKSVLSFKDEDWPLQPFKSSDFDIILLTFIISMVFTFTGILVSLLLCCTVNGRKRWRIICACVALMALIAVISCLIGIAYFEGKIADERLSGSYAHGWSSIVAWLGFGLLIIDTVLIIIITCVKPDDHSKKPHSVKSTASYVSSDTHETWASSRENKAFDHRDETNDAFYIGKNQKGKLEPTIPLNTYERSKTSKSYRISNEDEPDYGSPRGSNNLVYESDYRSSDCEYEPRKQSNEVVYDPRKRSTINDRRKRSFEMAYDPRTGPGESPDDSRRQTYSSGYPNTSDYSSRRQTNSTERDSRRHTHSTGPDYRSQVSTAGYDPRRKYSSPYETASRPPASYNPSNRTPRSSRYPNIDSEGYEIR